MQKTLQNLFLNYYGIAAENVLYNESYHLFTPSTQKNMCIPGAVYLFPSPVTDLNEYFLTTRFKTGMTAMFTSFSDLSFPGKKKLEGVIMPRQTAENFAPNN